MNSNGFQLGVICTMAHQLRSIRQSWCWTQTRLTHVGVWRLKIKRRVVEGRKETTHQLAGTANGSVRASEFSLLVMRRECNQSVLWQHNCGCVCQQLTGGGNSVPELYSLFHLGTLLVVWLFHWSLFTFLELRMHAPIGYRASIKAASNGDSILQSLSE